MPRLDRLLSLYCFNPLIKLRPAKNPAIPILMYHSISDEPESGHPYFWINTSAKRFAEHMLFLKKNDYKVISLSEAVDILGLTSNMSANLFMDSAKTYFSFYRYVVLTFDDGFHDFLKQAWPILSEFGFTATVFVPTAFIGDSRQSFNGRECLTWSEVRELLRHGVSFGSHTLSHSKLYELPWKEVRRELLDSRLRLEDELQTHATFFSYPYAFPQEDQSFVLRLRQELITQGYLIAVTTAIGRAQRGSDPLCLKRLPVNEGDDVKLLKAKLSGAYNWLYWPQHIYKKLKSSTLQ